MLSEAARSTPSSGGVMSTAPAASRAVLRRHTLSFVPVARHSSIRPRTSSEAPFDRREGLRFVLQGHADRGSRRPWYDRRRKTGAVRWPRLSERAHLPAAGLSIKSQYGAWRPVNMGKCRTLSVSKREPVRMAVAAIARSALSMV